MNLEEAKNRVRQAIKESINYNGAYEIDANGIIETDVAWYIPFMDIGDNKQDIPIGAYYGFIVGKVLGDLHQPGSAFSIEKWLTSYELGLLGGPHDLIITKIKNRQFAIKYLRKLNLSYFRLEIESSITWKIPKPFTDKMLDERLANLPCKFKNQRFTFNFEEFKEIKESKIFEYELIKTVNAIANEIGERKE